MLQVVSDEPVPPTHLQSQTPRDLETICLKCLQKEPGRRYASAEGLADDLRRFQAGEPIRARPVGAVERAWKWAQRRPAAAALLGVVLLALVSLAVLSGQLRAARDDADEKRKAAEQEADNAKKAREFLVSIFQKAERDDKGANVTIRRLLEEADSRIPVEFADQPDLREHLVSAIARVKRGVGRRTPQAMLLEVRGAVRLESAAGVPKAAVPQALLNLDDHLTLSADAQVQLVFVSDFHKERIKPGREATIDFKGCEPADAVLERDDSVLMTFVRLPKGTFYMGWDDTATPPRKGVKTEIKEDFWIAAHDVTQGQWQAIMGNNPSYFSRRGKGKGDFVDISDEELKLFPVEEVSWDDAQELLKKLNEKERGRGYVYRLPTEAEWEYACRGGATSEDECSHLFYLDKPTNDLSSEQANFNGNLPAGKAPKGPYLERPTRVGAYPSNKLGLCDMHGNVLQWCADAREGSGQPIWFGGAHDSVGGEAGVDTIRDALEGSARVVRGGSWKYGGGVDCRASSRFWSGPSNRFNNLGLRLAADPVR
jgi:formylglycine-generating enzyme required for sulfatase activity